MKIILHIESLDDAILAVRTAKLLARHYKDDGCSLIGCSFSDALSFSAIRRKSGTITVYKQPESAVAEPSL